MQTRKYRFTLAPAVIPRIVWMFSIDHEGMMYGNNYVPILNGRTADEPHRIRRTQMKEPVLTGYLNYVKDQIYCLDDLIEGYGMFTVRDKFVPTNMPPVSSLRVKIGSTQLGYSEKLVQLSGADFVESKFEPDGSIRYMQMFTERVGNASYDIYLLSIFDPVKRILRIELVNSNVPVELMAFYCVFNIEKELETVEPVVTDLVVVEETKITELQGTCMEIEMNSLYSHHRSYFLHDPVGIPVGMRVGGTESIPIPYGVFKVNKQVALADLLVDDAELQMELIKGNIPEGYVIKAKYLWLLDPAQSYPYLRTPIAHLSTKFVDVDAGAMFHKYVVDLPDESSVKFNLVFSQLGSENAVFVMHHALSDHIKTKQIAGYELHLVKEEQTT